MTEKNKQTETPSKPDDTAKAKTQQAKPKVAAAKPDSKPSFGFQGILRLLLTLFVLTILGAVGWVGWMQWQEGMTEINASSIELSRLEGTINKLEKQRRQDQDRQAVQMQIIQQMQQDLTDLQLRTNSLGARLAELGSTTRSDWLLAEALNLARLANHRLQTERSTRNPLALLESVNKILQELDDPQLLPVRSAVMADMSALRLVDQVDLEGIFLELGILIKAIERLEIQGAYGKSPIPKESSELQQDQPKKLNELAVGFTEKLSQLITIRHREQTIEPLLQPTEEALLRQNLRLMLEQSQAALLREQQAVYSESLSKAQSWLASYFQHNPNARLVEQQLADLVEVKIVQQLPPINGSLAALENYLLIRQSRLSDPAEPESLQ